MDPGTQGQGAEAATAKRQRHPAEYEWDIAANNYKVRIDGKWYTVPADAVIDEPKQVGICHGLVLVILGRRQ
jgi:hypothetical protein